MWYHHMNLPSFPVRCLQVAGCTLEFCDTATMAMQIELSDVISFHNYDSAEEFEKRVRWLQAYNQPILCTEYMARPNNSTFQGILPVAKKYKVAAFNSSTASRPCGSTTSSHSMGNPSGPRRSSLSSR